MSNTYQELTVWQKSVELAVLVYKITKDFPQSELYGLVNQLRRCAVAIASNIAEGQGRGSAKEFRQFIKISFGSLLELETQIIISKRVGYVGERQTDPIFTLSSEIKKMLSALEKAIIKNK